MTRDTDAARRDRRSTAAAVAVLAVILTVIAAPILAAVALRFSEDRAALDAYDAAPVCSAGASSDHSCRLRTEYRVDSEYSRAGRNSVYYLYLTDSSGQTRIQVQLPSPTGVWPAADGETVTVTSWRGTAVSVSDGRHVTQLVGSPDLQLGDGAYTVLVLAGAAYLYLLLIVTIRRMAGPLLLVPVATVITGIALHGRFVGGPSTHDFLLVITGSLALVLVIGLLTSRVRRTD